MPKFRTGVVSAILAERPGLQRVEVDGELAYVLTAITGDVALGDRVVVNVTAVELGLGTGGWHVVHWNLAREELDLPGSGHIMKLRYTSLQADTGVAEEHGYLSPFLENVPVVGLALHSQLAPVAAAVKSVDRALRVVYVMTDAGALPIALSDLVADLREAGLVDGTVTVGHAFGGDEEAINARSGMCVARHRLAADVIVVGMGPGSVGTGTQLGYSGLEVGALLQAASDSCGQPIAALRYSAADARERHRGVSHHTRTAVVMTQFPLYVPVPTGEPDPGGFSPPKRVVWVDVPDVAAELTAAGVAVTTMGRTLAEDPLFFAYAAAAGVCAAQVAARRTWNGPVSSPDA